MGFPGSSAGKESPSNVGDLGLIPGLGRSPGPLEARRPLLLCLRGQGFLQVKKVAGDTDVWERLADSSLRGKFSVLGLETL